MPPRPLRKGLHGLARMFADIQVTLAEVEKRLRRAERTTAAKAPPDLRRKVRITAKRRAQLKLQGAYMGFVRQLKPAQKARVKAVKQKRGYEAAIRMAREVAGR